MTGAQPGMTGAVRNNEGSQFREDECQSPSFLRKQESKGNGHHTRKANKKMEASNAPAASGLDRLLSDSLIHALEEDSSHTAEVSSQWMLKGEWGFALHNATGIPYASLSASDAKHDLTLGWRLLSSPSGLQSELDIKAMRRQQNNNEQNHGIGAELKLYW